MSGLRTRAPQCGLGLQLSLCVPPGSLQKDPAYWLQMQKVVTVQEGLCVHVSCSFSYPEAAVRNHSIPTYGYWRKDNSKASEKPDDLVATNNPDKEAKMKNKLHFRLLGDPQANNCSLSISNAQKADSGRYYFRLEKGPSLKYSYKNNLLTLIVTGKDKCPVFLGTWVDSTVGREHGQGPGGTPGLEGGSGAQVAQNGGICLRGTHGSPLGSGLSLSPPQA